MKPIQKISLIFIHFILGIGSIASTAFAAERPNIILVLVDDMGWSDLSCFGNTTIQTPNIDRLAMDGTTFTNFYVSAPICSPSRCAITTGQYPYRWRITSFLDNRRANEQRGMVQWLDPKAPTLARFLQQVGYATGHFGKWHLGGQRDVGDAPLITEYGFDETLTNFEGLGPRVLPLLNAFDGSESKKYALGSDNLGRGDITWVDRNKVTSCFVEKSLEFIKKAEKTGKPFFVNLWPDDVHSPYFPASELRGSGSKKDLYHGVLVELDQQLAPLFDYVRNSETLRKNTLIVLLSDNGPEPGAGSSAPLRGHKGMLFDGGTRSPLIVWGDGLLKQETRGNRNETAVFQSVDLVPSLLKIAGVDASMKATFDGEDFSDVLLGNKSTQARRKPIFWRRPPDRPGPSNDRWPDLALRHDNWKFLMQFNGSKPRLFDLDDDVSEQNNIADKHPSLTEEFRNTLNKWNATMPKDAGETSAVTIERSRPRQKAKTGSSNIVLIVADDLGYSDLGCYGGEIATPNLDKLAAGGIRFTQFYNTTRCCPSRASLNTGLYPHQAGIGLMSGRSNRRGYEGYLTDRCVTLAEVLQSAGYRTYMSGKWHMGVDPSELDNIADKRAETVARLADAWNRWAERAFVVDR